MCKNTQKPTISIQSVLITWEAVLNSRVILFGVKLWNLNNYQMSIYKKKEKENQKQPTVGENMLLESNKLEA